jgi:hypothetical protein
MLKFAAHDWYRIVSSRFIIQYILIHALLIQRVSGAQYAIISREKRWGVPIE